MIAFYVYILFRPNGIPCYVGKGNGARWNRHENLGDDHYNKHLARIITKAGGSLPKVKTREGLTEAEAFETEIALIAAIGREVNGGPLVNLTDGGEGISGLRHSEVTKDKLRYERSKETNRKNAEAQRLVWASRTPEERAALHKKNSESLKGLKHNEAWRKASGIGLKNSPKNGQRKIKIGLSHKGRVKSSAECAAISRGRTGLKLGPYAKSHRDAIRAGQLAAWARRKAERIARCP